MRTCRSMDHADSELAGALLSRMAGLLEEISAASVETRILIEPSGLVRLREQLTEAARLLDAVIKMVADPDAG